MLVDVYSDLGTRNNEAVVVKGMPPSLFPLAFERSIEVVSKLFSIKNNNKKITVPKIIYLIDDQNL